MSKAIRLSPSGPNITNGNGAPFAPGPGARLRLVESASSGTQTVTAAPGAGIVAGDGVTVLAVALDHPNPGLEYRATIICDVENDSTNVTAIVQLYLDMSPDNATWTQVAANGHLVGFSSMRQIRCDLPLNFGSNGLGIVANQANVFLRARVAKTGGAAITASAGGVTGVNVGATLLQLEECL